MANYSKLISNLRTHTDRCVDLKWRRAQLSSLLRLFVEQQDLINEALYKDLRRPRSESIILETATIKTEIAEALNQLDDWTGPIKVKKNLITTLDTAYTQAQPLGTVLIIGAWNYPFQVTLIPLVGALAAGNCVVLKPSEISVHSANLMQQLIQQYLDNDCVKVVLGGAMDTKELLKEKFDHIFYTGSTAVGKLIYKAAAENLTPVTLELGGKSPVVVDKTSNLLTVARRLMWAKLCNAGQTCISPDYVLADKSIVSALIEECIKSVGVFHNGDSKLTKDYSRIISANHFNRLKSMLSTTQSTFKLGSLSTCDIQEFYIPPTILDNVALDDVLMRDEIFGPILPFVGVDDMDQAIQIINSKPHPLVVYLFSKDSKMADKFNTSTKSGSLVVNDLFVQMTIADLPFGGVGDSGMGKHHGKKTFDCFTNQKSVLLKKQNLEFVNDMKYPPYTDNKLKVLSWTLSKKPKDPNSMLQRLPFVVIVALAIAAFALMANLVR